jgi:hypothetical protein
VLIAGNLGVSRPVNAQKAGCRPRRRIAAAESARYASDSSRSEGPALTLGLRFTLRPNRSPSVSAGPSEQLREPRRWRFAWAEGVDHPGHTRECLVGGLECGATEVKSSSQSARCALRRCALRPGDDDDCRGSPRRLP